MRNLTSYSGPRAPKCTPRSLDGAWRSQRAGPSRVRLHDLLQAAARPGSPAGLCLHLAERGALDLCISEEILSEVTEILSRPRIRAKYSALHDDVVGSFLAAVRKGSRYVPDVCRSITLARDPDDEPYLNLAIHAKAAFLVTRDNDLLDLRSGTDPASHAIRKAHPALQIVDPITFLAFMRRYPFGRGHTPV